MSKRYNILFLASWYPNEIKPTNGNFIQKHAQVVSRNNNVFVIHVQSVDESKIRIVKKVVEQSLIEIIVYYPQFKFKLPVLSQIIRFKRNVLAHWAGYKEINESIDLVHCNVALPSGVFARILNKKFGLNYLVTEHWSKYLPQDKNEFNFIEKYLIKKIFKSAKVVSVVSSILADSLKLFTTKTIEIIPNSVDVEIFKPAQHKDDKSVTHKFIHISTLNNQEKNILGVLNAFSRVVKRDKNFEFTIVSDEDFEWLKNEIRQRELQNNIHLKGKMSTIEIAQEIKQHHTYISFSNYETFGITLAEASACGLNIISTYTGIAPELMAVSNKNQIIAVENVSQLVDALLKSINCDWTINKENRLFVIDHFSNEAVTKKIQHIYEKVH